MLTTAQVAKLFQVEPKTVRRWANPNQPRFKRLESVRLSPRTIRFTEAAIEDFKMRRSGLDPWQYRQQQEQAKRNQEATR